MKTERNILIAFILNLSFSVFELFGGLMTGSVAILSDALHDIGDAAGIGVSYFLEKKSKRHPDKSYTYGYGRFSVLGGLITTVILLVGSAVVIGSAVKRILEPVHIDYNGMILFAVVGVITNLTAAFFTREGDSLNQRAVNLHMMEDVLGWAVVLAVAILMRFTELAILDPIMSIGIAVFILSNAAQNLNRILDVFLEKVPASLNIGKISEHLSEIEGVVDIHHIHLWTLDGDRHYATLHAVCEKDAPFVKSAIRRELEEHGIAHVTIETETPDEDCSEKECRPSHALSHCHHHHNHHHHHSHHHH